MANQNSIANTATQQSFSSFVAMPAVRQKINDVIGGQKGEGFIASIVTAVSGNPQLTTCDYGTVLSSALLGAALNLSPSPQLGHFYMVPFNDNKNRRKVAQFQLGYKGYVQLAIRSGQYKNINVISLKEGELKHWDELTETIEYELMEDWEAREGASTVGYYAYFELINGFKKAMYWSSSRMMAHAKKYSKGFANDLAKGTSWTFWSKDFDGMAHKTMLRQLISKWGIMSVEMQQAMTSDMGVIHDTGTVEYIESDLDVVDLSDDPTPPEEPQQADAGQPEIVQTSTDDDSDIDDLAASFFG